MQIIELRAFVLIFCMLRVLLQFHLGKSSYFLSQCDKQYCEIIADSLHEEEEE